MWGWEAREVVEHSYDDEGRVVRSVTTREAEWDAMQRDLVVALESIEAQACSGCGEPVNESYDPQADPDNREGSHRYVADLPWVCHACSARDLRAKDYAEHPQRHAMKFPIRRVERGARHG